MWEPGPVAFLVLGLLSLVGTALTIRAAFRLAADLRRPAGAGPGPMLPAAILAPVRGRDPGLEENLAALLGQAYAEYRVIFAVDSLDDPAVPVIQAAIAAHGRSAEIVVSPGPSGGGSGKSAALARAAAELRPVDRLVVTYDADSRPHRRWLAELVDGLGPDAGVATTYRWYDARGGFWTAVRSSWNSSGFSLLFDDRYNFAWGGSLVMRREDFDRLRIREQWPDSLSDDLVVTLAVKRDGKRVAFVPRAICLSSETCDRAACIEWTTRQSGFVYAYYPRITSFALAAYGVFNGILLCGLLGLLLTAFVSPAFLPGSVLLLAELPLTLVTAEIRRAALARILPEWRDIIDADRGRFLAASLAVPWLMLVNLARVRRLRTIVWRGRTYALPAPIGPGR